MNKNFLDILHGTDIISQSGNCIIRLSRYLLTLNEGDRLITKMALARKYKLGVGTIQTSLQKLEDMGTIRLDSRGHMGTYIEKIDKNTLWKFSLYGYVCGTMPLPYNNILVGLATGIHNSFNNDGIMLRMSYIRGSRIRVQNLKDGLDDFTVCSEFTAQQVIKEDPTFQIFARFGDNTYMGNSVFLLSTESELKDGMCLGIDESSYDQALLSRIACEGKKINFVEVGYNNLFMMLKEKKIDGALWSFNDIKGREFSGNVVSIAGLSNEIRSAGCAVMLVSEHSLEKMSSVKKLFDTGKIVQTQKNVISGKEIPNY